MKKLLIAISMVLVLGGSAYAGSSRGSSFQGYSSGPITTTSQIISTRGAIINNITLNATSSNALMTIYDISAGPASETPIYEIEVATAGNTQSVDMNAAPLQTYTGLVASVTNGVGYMNIEK